MDSAQRCFIKSCTSFRVRPTQLSLEMCPFILLSDSTLTPDFNLTGLSRGGQQIQRSRDTYVKAVGTLVELASLQVSTATSPHL